MAVKWEVRSFMTLKEKSNLFNKSMRARKETMSAESERKKNGM